MRRGQPSSGAGGLGRVLLRCLLAAVLVATACAPNRGPGPAAADDRPIEGGSVSGAFLAGHVALARGDLATAAEGLARGLDATPNDADLRRQVFHLRVSSGDVAGSRALAPSLVDDPNVTAAADALLWLAIDALPDRPEAARAALAAVDDGTLPGLLRPLILAWLEPDPLAGAAALAAAETRLGEVTVFHRVALLDRGDRPAEALAALAAIGTEPSEMPERFLAEQARLLMRVGEPDAALALLRLGAREPLRSDRVAQVRDAIAAGVVPPPAIADPAAGIADTLLGVAELLAAQQRPLQATFYVRLALRAVPDYDPALLLLAALLEQQEGPHAAIAALERIDDRSVWHAAAQLALANAEADTGEIDAAVDRLRQATAARPEDAMPAMALGDLLRRESRFDEAAAAYAQALARVDPSDPEHWRLFYARGIAYERSRRWPEAERDLKRALELQPDQPYVLNYLGYSWVDQGQNLTEAKAMLYRAVELRPDDGFIVDSLGWAYYRLGDYEQAVIYLERAIELEPGDPVINDHLGDAYWQVGRKREARFQWERTLGLDPDDATAESAREKLQRGLADRNAG